MITGTFSIVRQSIALGCFPRVTVRHTSAGVEGARKPLECALQGQGSCAVRLRQRRCTRLLHQLRHFCCG